MKIVDRYLRLLSLTVRPCVHGVCVYSRPSHLSPLGGINPADLLLQTAPLQQDSVSLWSKRLYQLQYHFRWYQTILVVIPGNSGTVCGWVCGGPAVIEPNDPHPFSRYSACQQSPSTSGILGSTPPCLPTTHRSITKSSCGIKPPSPHDPVLLSYPVGWSLLLNGSELISFKVDWVYEHYMHWICITRL